MDGEGGYFRAIRTAGGRTIALDQLFAVQGQTPQTEIIDGLGVELSRHGYITVDTEQKTSVPGVYAAGDVTRLHSHQISTAVHEGGQAACAANYYLYPPEMKDEKPQHGPGAGLRSRVHRPLLIERQHDSGCARGCA